MKTRLSSFIRRCAVQGLALVALATSSAVVAVQLLVLLALIATTAPAHAQRKMLRMDTNPDNLAGGACLARDPDVREGSAKDFFRLAACADLVPTWQLERVSGRCGAANPDMYLLRYREKMVVHDSYTYHFSLQLYDPDHSPCGGDRRGGFRYRNNLLGLSYEQCLDYRENTGEIQHHQCDTHETSSRWFLVDPPIDGADGSAFPSADVESGHYALQTWDGQPVTVQDDGSLIAGGAGTRFGVYYRNDGTYAIQGNSTWLNADENGLSSSAPNGDYAEQHFYLADVGDGKLGIKTSEGLWAFTDENMGGQISLNPGQVPHWWTFTLVRGPSRPTAAVKWSNDVAYFFNEDQYLRFDIPADQVNSGYPLPIEGQWEGWPADFVPTAAVNWGNGVTYFFSEDMRYLRFDMDADQVNSGYPLPIEGKWEGWPADFAPTAAVKWSNDVAYFFSEDQYLRFDIAADRVNSGYPLPIEGHWGGWPADFAPTAAVKWSNDVAYFFSGDQYLRFDIAADRVNSGYPLPIEGQWEGWPIIE